MLIKDNYLTRFNKINLYGNPVHYAAMSQAACHDPEYFRKIVALSLKTSFNLILSDNSKVEHWFGFLGSNCIVLSDTPDLPSDSDFDNITSGPIDLWCVKVDFRMYDGIEDKASM